jgi:hypothetical protein
VKALRLWLLLVLVVLLPVRGAVAAAMLCPAAGSGVQLEVHAVEHPLGHHQADQAMAHDHGGDHRHAGAAADAPVDPQGHHGAGSDKCNMCSAYCSLTPLVGTVPALAEPLDLTAAQFAAPTSPAPSFVSDVQERPPRTS